MKGTASARCVGLRVVLICIRAGVCRVKHSAIEATTRVFSRGGRSEIGRGISALSTLGRVLESAHARSCLLSDAVELGVGTRFDAFV